MIQFLCLRIGRAIVTVWFAVTVTFVLIRVLPGDPTIAIASTTMTPELRSALLTQYGLDRPLVEQYVTYIAQLLHGNLGYSFTQSIPVTDVLLQRLPWTLLLSLVTVIITLAVGIPLGVWAAARNGGVFDRTVQLAGVFGQSVFIPSFGIVLLIVFGVILRWSPIGGAYDTTAYGIAWYGSVATHLVLPACTLAISQLGSYVLTLRTTLIDCLHQDYVEVARAAGFTERRILWRHALRNALLPTTTLLGLQLGFLVGGAVLTETMFAYPGIGRGIFEAVTQLDYPVLQGAFLMLAVSVVVANTATDIAYGLLDPRVRTR